MANYRWVINGPKYFGRESYYGEVEKNKVADLIVLDSNPLEDVANLGQIDAVIYKSNLLTPNNLINETRSSQ